MWKAEIMPTNRAAALEASRGTAAVRYVETGV